MEVSGEVRGVEVGAAWGAMGVARREVWMVLLLAGLLVRTSSPAHRGQ